MVLIVCLLFIPVKESETAGGTSGGESSNSEEECHGCGGWSERYDQRHERWEYPIIEKCHKFTYRDINLYWWIMDKIKTILCAFNCSCYGDFIFMGFSDFVEKLVETVQTLFHNKSGINVTAALQKVKGILKEIKDRDFNNSLERALRENK